MISVVIPVHDCADLIGEAIDSVLRQDGDLVSEIIVVDDGSTDALRRVLSPWRSKLQLIHQENRGVAAARNRGIEAARTEWIAFLDADDAWLPERLHRQFDIVRRNDQVSFVFSDFSVCDGDWNVIQDRGITTDYGVFSSYRLEWADVFEQSMSLNDTERAYVGYVFGSLFLGNYIKTSSVLVRRELLKEAGGFDAGLRTQEDYELWLRLASRSRFAYLDRPLVMSRRRPDQLTSRKHMGEVVEKSLEVTERYEVQARRVLGHSVVDERMSDKRTQLALAHLGKRRRHEARRMLWLAWRGYPMNFRALGLMILSVLPLTLTAAVRHASNPWRRSGRTHRTADSGP